jgi:hypothetical protein
VTFSAAGEASCLLRIPDSGAPGPSRIAQGRDESSLTQPLGISVQVRGRDEVSDTRPQIGDTLPANPYAEGPQVVEDTRDPRDIEIERLQAELEKAQPPAQLREYAERVQQRNAKLEPLEAENASLRRQLGLAWAQVDPDSLLGQTVVTAAAADGVSDPTQVAALARTLRAELNGGSRRKEKE